MKAALSFLGVCLFSAGCTTTMTAYEGAALQQVKAADDNAIRVWSAAACGTPYSAAIRNPDVIPALKALCLPAGSAADPATLLK